MIAYGDAEGWGALADRTRRAIVASLADRPHSVGELAAQLPVSRPAVSQHLKVLKDAGLVGEHQEGTRRIYQLNQPDWPRCAISSTATGGKRSTATPKSYPKTPMTPINQITGSKEDNRMTQTEVTVRRHVVVDAAIDRAFLVFTEQFGDFKPPEHNLLSAPSPRLYSSRGWAATSLTEPSTAPNADGHASWSTSRRSASSSAGTSALNGAS